jgi:hypothetical protein
MVRVVAEASIQQAAQSRQDQATGRIPIDETEGDADKKADSRPHAHLQDAFAPVVPFSRK